MADYTVPSTRYRLTGALGRGVHLAQHVDKLVLNERRFFAVYLPPVFMWAQGDDNVANGDPATPTSLFERSAIWIPELMAASPVEFLVRAVIRDAETGVAGAGLVVTFDDGASTASTTLVNTATATLEEIEDSVWAPGAFAAEGTPIMMTVSFGSTNNVTVGALYAIHVQPVAWVAGDFP